MARHIFFPETTTDSRRVGDTMSTYYRYNGEVLSIYWKNRKVVKMKVAPGTPVWVDCSGRMPTVKVAQLPKRKASLVAWMLGFPREMRCYTRKEYNARIEQAREEERRWDEEYSVYYDEREVLGEGWGIAIEYRSYAGTRLPEYGAILVEDKAAKDKEVVKAILKSWKKDFHRDFKYPVDFVYRVLTEQFGFTEADLADIG